MTGRIKSNVKSLSRLLIHPIPVKPVLVNAAVRIEDTVVLVDLSGKVFSNKMTSRNYFGRGSKAPNLFKALVRLGLVTAADIKQHETEVEADLAARNRRSSSQWILDEAGRAGLKLSPKQRAQLQRQAEP